MKRQSSQLLCLSSIMKQLTTIIFFISLSIKMSKCFSSYKERNTTSFKNILSYSFEGFSCIQLYSGMGELPREYYKVLYEIGIPVIINESQKYCYGFFLVAKDAIQLRILLFGLRKYYNDRIVCYLYDEDSTIIELLENESFIFGDSEALVVNEHQAYKLEPLERKFYALNIDEEEKWGEYHEIMNFEGRTITVASFNISLFSAIGPLDDKGKPGLIVHVVGWVSGLDFDTFSLLATLMNVTWKVTVPSEENKWGYKLANGSWSGGIYKALMEKRADVGLACVWLTFEKYQSFSLSNARNMVSIRHLVRRPRLNPSWGSPVRSFTLPVWGSLLAALIITTLSISFLTHLMNKIYKDFVYKEWSSPWVSGYMVLGVLLMTAVPPSAKKQGPIRHFLNGLVLTCFFLGACFGSCLVSHLTTPDLQVRPQTIKELVQGEYLWGMTADLKPDMSLVLDLDNPWHRQWADRFVLIRNKEEHIRMLDDDKFVLWGKSVEDVGYYLNENYLPSEKLAEWEISSEAITNFYFTFALTPGSQFLPAMDKYTALITEAGFTGRLLQMTFSREGKIYMKEVLTKTKGGLAGASALTISHFKGLFCVLSVGLLFASISFCIEMIYSKNIILNLKNAMLKKFH